MPEAVTFEEAIDRLRKVNPGMSQGQALKQMSDWHTQGDPEVAKIPDITGKLRNAALSGAVHGLVSGLAETIDQPVRGLSQMVAAGTQPGGMVHGAAESVANRFDPKNIEAYKAQAMPGPAETVGDVAGQGVGLGLSAAAMGPFAKAIPGLGGAGALSTIGRGAAETLGLQQFGELGKMSPADALKWGAIGGAVAPAIGKVATKLFGRDISPAIEGGDALEPAKRSPFDNKVASPTEDVGEAPLTRQGEYSFPPKPAPPPTLEPAGTANIRTGRPFDLKTSVRMPTSRSGLDVWGDPRNPVFGEGPAYPTSFDKPMVIDVPSAGEEGWVHAATSLYADNPRIVDALREAKDPIGMAQELVGRAAKKGGYDAVNLSTPSITSNVTMGVPKDWKPSSHPELTNDLFKFSKKPVQSSPFAQAQAKDLGEQIRQVPSDDEGGDLAKESKKVREHMIRKLKNPDPNIHAMGDPDLAAQVKQMGVVSGNTGAYEPEIQEIKRYMEARAPFTKWLPSHYGSDDPSYARTFSNTYEELDTGEKWANDQMKEYQKFREEFPDIFTKNEDKRLKNFDEVARAADGWEYDVDRKKYSQTAINVDDRVNKAARRLVQIRDNGYTRISGNDPKVPYVVERYGLSHSRSQLERLRALQESGGPPQVKPGTRPWSNNYMKVYTDLMPEKRPARPEEVFAAQELEGMLKFDFTHDLDFEPLTGFLKFHPHANEKIMLEDAIKQYKSFDQAGQDGEYKPPRFDDQENLERMVARLDNLESKVMKDQNRRMPATDYLPKRKWMSIINMKDHPEAQPHFYDTNPDHIVGTWVTTHNNKRVADVALAYANKVIKDPAAPASLKDRLVDWGNAVRGSTGFRADAATAQNVNGMLHGVGSDYRVTPQQIHKIASTIQDYIRFTMLELSPFRFPMINLTHVLPTVYPLAGEKYMARGVAKVLGDMTGSYKLAADEGIIGHDSEWFKEIGQTESKLSGSKLSQILRYPTWMTENMRKVVAHQVGLEMAKDSEFSPVVRAFVRDPKEYENATQMQRAYARAFVKTTQFELGNTGKPINFVGGLAKRLALQFRSWPANLAGLYSEMYRQKDWAGLTRGAVALFMLGGARALSPVPSVYDAVRLGMLRSGHNFLPERPGYQYLLSALGIHDSSIEQINIPTLRDPFGTDIYNPSSLLGPAIGKTIDTLGTIYKDASGGKTYKIPVDVTKALVGPQATAFVQAGQEIMSGGVFGPTGVLASNRPVLGTIARGMDIQPSVGMQRREVETNLENAMVGGNKKVINDLIKDAKERGIVLGPDSQRRIRAFVYAHKKSEVTPWQWKF